VHGDHAQVGTTPERGVERRVLQARREGDRAIAGIAAAQHGPVTAPILAEASGFTESAGSTPATG
jgi:hypothetical protein